MSIKQILKKFINEWVLAHFNLQLYSTSAFGRDSIHGIKCLVPKPMMLFDVGANVG